MENNYFAAFIMTYQRVTTLESTINALLNQTVPPQKILIVDNDPEKSAEVLLSKFSNILVEYHPVGYNSGPAGAAKVGLEILSTQGYKWIGWMDDDDPPIFIDTFSILLKIALANKKCGCVGNVGQYFNKKTGLMIRVPDCQLEGEGIFEVDNIAGNMCKIINADVCLKAKVYPDESLFFGFEELDFDLRLQEAGYVLVVDKELYKRHRLYWNRIEFTIKKGVKKDLNRLKRDYYSIRNSLIIIKKHKLFTAFFLTFTRSLLKIIRGFRYGIGYGYKNAKFIIYALIHFLIGKKGLVSIE
jgi:GT2 family glycosyltransferase